MMPPELPAACRLLPPYTMDDGCGLMHMTQGNIFAFRSSRILTGDRSDLDRAFRVRFDTVNACKKCEIVAVVNFDSGNQKSDS